MVGTPTTFQAEGGDEGPNENALLLHPDGQTITILRGLTQVQQLAVLAFVSMLRSGRGGDRVTLSVYYTSFVALCRQWKLDSMCCDKSEFLSVRPSSIPAHPFRAYVVLPLHT